MIEILKDGAKVGSGTAIDVNESTGIDIVATHDGHEGDLTISVEDAATETVTTGSPTLTIPGSTALDSSGGAITGTLGSGTYIGQTKVIVMTDATTSSTISITNHETSDPEVATFDAVDEYWYGLWTGTEWATISNTCTFV